MKHKSSHEQALLCCAVIFASLFSVPLIAAGGGYSVQVVQKPGDSLRGSPGATVTKISAYMVSKAKKIAFPVMYRGGQCEPGRECKGLAAYSEGQSALVATEGQELTGGAARLSGWFEGLSLNGSGAISFLGGYRGDDCSPPGNSCSIVMVHSKDELRSIARQGRLVPKTNGGVLSQHLGMSALTDDGHVIFSGEYRKGNCKSSGTCSGLYRTTRDGIEAVLTQYEPIGGMKEARFYEAKALSANRHGVIALLLLYKGQCGNEGQLCFGEVTLSSEGKVTAIAQQGQAAPGITGATYVGGQGNFGFGPPALNDKGAVAYVAELKSGAAIFAAEGSGSRVLVQPGQEAPGTGGAKFSQFSPEVSINDDGEIAFRGLYQGGNCASESCAGIFVAGGSSPVRIRYVALHGQKTSGATVETIEGINVPAFHEGGSVAFAARVSSGQSMILLAKPAE